MVGRLVGPPADPLLAIVPDDVEPAPLPALECGLGTSYIETVPVRTGGGGGCFGPGEPRVLIFVWLRISFEPDDNGATEGIDVGAKVEWDDTLLLLYGTALYWCI